MKLARFSVLGAVLVAALALAAISPAYAATFDVDTTDDNGALTACTAAPADCSLRGAILNASSNGVDDTINVPAGTYTLTSGTELLLNENTTTMIVGADPATTIIAGDGVSVRRVFHLVGGNVTFQNLTIRDGVCEDNCVTSTYQGGGIYAEGTSTTLDNVVLTNNTARQGGGIYNIGDLTVINGSDIYDNAANHPTTHSRYGGGIFVEGDNTLIITDSTVRSNQAEHGAGVYVRDNATTVITNSTFGGPNPADGNAADNVGGGINQNGGTLDIVSSTFQYNTTNGANGVGGGVYAKDTETTIRDNTLIADNESSYYGGGIVAVLSGQLTIVNSTVQDNSTDEPGGGLFASVPTTTIASSQFLRNTAAGSAGGLSVSGDTIVITDTLVDDNQSGGSGAGMALNGDNLLILRTTVTNNEIVQPANPTNSANGAGISLGDTSNGSTAQIIDSIISDNTITGGTSSTYPNYGAGIYFRVQYQPDDQVEIINTTISGNQNNNVDEGLALGGGLGVEVADTTNDSGATLTLERVTISGNSVSSENSFAQGAGIYLGAQQQADGLLTTNLINVTLANNDASSTGSSAIAGGVVIWTGQVNITNSTIAGNTAGGAPRVLYAAEGSAFIQNSIVAGQTGTICDVGFGQTITSGGYNLDENGECGLAGTGDITPADALLNALANNGGQTETIALQATSPALDAANNANCPATDERGVARGYNAVDGVDNPEPGDCDMGAFELSTLFPDLTVVNSNNVGGASDTVSSWDWIFTGQNGGSGSAIFDEGQSVLSSNLPDDPAISYGSVSVSVSGGVTGSMTCSINTASNLDCVADPGGIVILAGGQFVVTINSVQATVAATYTNPRSGGVCAVDPANLVYEGGAGDDNNTCGDSVRVLEGEPQPPDEGEEETEEPGTLAPTATPDIPVTLPETGGQPVAGAPLGWIGLIVLGAAGLTALALRRMRSAQ
jgi:hypothetical protein